MAQYAKKGYLDGQFRLFHLTDQETREIDHHFHQRAGHLRGGRPLL